MASLNKVIIMGRLGQDPELKYTPSQVPVVTLNVATTETWTGKDGQKQEQTEWHRVIVWSRQAENCSKYLAKGRLVLVDGRLQTRSWEDRNGQKRYTTEIIANNVQFLPQSSGANAPREDNMGAHQFPPAEMSLGGRSNEDAGAFPMDDIPF